MNSVAEFKEWLDKYWDFQSDPITNGNIICHFSPLSQEVKDFITTNKIGIRLYLAVNRVREQSVTGASVNHNSTGHANHWTVTTTIPNFLTKGRGVTELNQYTAWRLNRYVTLSLSDLEQDYILEGFFNVGNGNPQTFDEKYDSLAYLYSCLVFEVIQDSTITNQVSFNLFYSVVIEFYSWDSNHHYDRHYTRWSDVHSYSK